MLFNEIIIMGWHLIILNYWNKIWIYIYRPASLNHYIVECSMLCNVNILLFVSTYMHDPSSLAKGENKIISNGTHIVICMSSV